MKKWFKVAGAVLSVLVAGGAVVSITACNYGGAATARPTAQSQVAAPGAAPGPVEGHTSSYLSTSGVGSNSLGLTDRLTSLDEDTRRAVSQYHGRLSPRSSGADGFANAPEFDLTSVMNADRDRDASPFARVPMVGDIPVVDGALNSNGFKNSGLGSSTTTADGSTTGLTKIPAPKGLFEVPPNILDYPSSTTEELLIIERKRIELVRATAQATDTALGSGGLVCYFEENPVTVPLKHTDVKGSVTGYISAVTVKQQFTNPYSSKIEAVYVFPLPESAAVSDFVMTIGDRNIRGIIREREEAQQIYAQARAQGHTASLLTQERPNIFTQKVANIEPGKAIDINITYYSTLTYSDGGYEFVFPMVVGPRFNPPGTTEGVGSVAKGEQGASGQATEVQYVRPDERTGHDIAISVDIDACVSIESLECKTHKIETRRSGPSRATVKLSSSDKIPNRDFVLRWQVAGDSVKSAILAHQDAKGGYFTMMLVPPKDLKRVPRNAVEMIFVLDRSGSMSGVPMQQAQIAIARGLERLQPGDTFQILDFAESASQMGEAPVLMTNASIAKGKQYLASLDANGGTYMIKGLNAALDFPHDPERLRFVAFCTDGFIGNEAEVLGVLNQKLGATRVFSFGVGNCNRYLMDSMARMGSGLVTYLGIKDDASTIMDSFFDRISHAPMSDIKIDWAGANVTEVYPSRVPDLFVGRPVILTGRFNGALPSSVRVSGRMGSDRREIAVSATLAGDATSTNALSQVWARAKLTDLAEQAAWNLPAQAELAQATKKTALDYCLLSDYTAFVAVDSSVRTSGSYGTTVVVPVPVPEGVQYETAVQEK